MGCSNAVTTARLLLCCSVSLVHLDCLTKADVECRAELTDTVGLQPALPGMGRTGYPPAEEARTARLDHIQSPKAQTPGKAPRHSPGAKPGAASDSPERMAGAVGNSPGPVAEGMEEEHVELSRFSVAASVESCDVYGAPAPMLISRYERRPPPETIEGKPGLGPHPDPLPHPQHIIVHVGPVAILQVYSTKEGAGPPGTNRDQDGVMLYLCCQRCLSDLQNPINTNFERSASVSVVCTLRQAHTTAWTDKPTLQRGQTIAHYSLQGNCPHVVGMRVIGHYTEAQPAAQEQYITGGRLTTCQAITEGLA